MMNLILPVTLIWALCSTAGALQCLTCTDAQCSSTVSSTCSSETQCITATVQVTLNGAPVQQPYKACASSSLCPVAGFQTFSANLGSTSVMASAHCCKTDDCNSADLVFVEGAANNLRCYSCLNSECSAPVQCAGVENRCIQAKVTSGSTTAPYLGCVSANLCSAAAGMGSIPFLQNLGNITGALSCCDTSLCNALTTTPSPTTTAALTPACGQVTDGASDACCVRLIHLLLGLFIFFFF